MKTNYDLIFQDTIKNLSYKPKLLLHVCCGPCCSNVITENSQYFDITIYYSNSNIYPSEEYHRRYQELLDFIKAFNQKYDQHIQVFEDPYEPDAYLEKLKPFASCKEGQERCYLCYGLRMHKAHQFALEGNYDYWTTVLSVSPHKNSQWINEIGSKYHDQHLQFLYADFKKRDGYKKSVQTAASYGLYRQNYCGCIYSYEDMLEREKTKLEK